MFQNDDYMMTFDALMIYIGFCKLIYINSLCDIYPHSNCYGHWNCRVIKANLVRVLKAFLPKIAASEQTHI